MRIHELQTRVNQIQLAINELVARLLAEHLTEHEVHALDQQLFWRTAELVCKGTQYLSRHTAPLNRASSKHGDSRSSFGVMEGKATQEGELWKSVWHDE